MKGQKIDRSDADLVARTWKAARGHHGAGGVEGSGEMKPSFLPRMWINFITSEL